jgi:hypothetical protein
MSTEPALLSPKQAAAFLSVDPKTIHMLLAKGLPQHQPAHLRPHLRRDHGCPVAA